MTATDEILFETRGPLGLVTLNRPKQLNALTLDMVIPMREKLLEWAQDDAVKCVVVVGEGEKGFCAGGDIRALHDSGKDGTPYALDFFGNEYRNNYVISQYSKPYVAILDGITMGGGVGLSVHAPFRVLTDRTRFAMPETGIGLIPDVGGSHFLPRLPGQIGMFLGLTGERLGPADTLYTGVGTHYAADDALGDLIPALEQADYAGDAHQVVETVLREHAGNPGEPGLAQHREEIDRLFAGGSVEAIVDAMDRSESDWANQQVATLRTKSPTSVKLTFKQIKEGAVIGIGDCLKMEYRLVARIMEAHDFFEGVRAVIIDKDNKPQWKPDTFEGVSAAEINRYFASLGARELDLN